MISPCESVDLPRHTQTLVITMVVAIFEEVGPGTIVSDAEKNGWCTLLMIYHMIPPSLFDLQCWLVRFDV